MTAPREGKCEKCLNISHVQSVGGIYCVCTCHKSLSSEEQLKAKANELFDNLYGQPREDLDEREMRVICEFLVAYGEERYKHSKHDGVVETHRNTVKVEAEGYRRGIEEAAKRVEKEYWNVRGSDYEAEKVLAERIRELDKKSGK